MMTTAFWRAPLAGALAVVAALAAASPALAQFVPDQEIEYRDGSAGWTEGVAVRMTPNGSQVVIRQKPTTYFPEGSQRAYDVADIRPRQPPQPVAAAPARAAAPPAAAVAQGTGLLNQQQILAYSRQALGPNPYANPNREAALAEIRDYIKGRGVNFRSTLDFDNQMGAIGANSVHISYAIGDNYGAAPRQQDYFGDFNLTSQNRGSSSVQQAGGRRVIETTDSAARLGSLKINPGGTYVWNVLGDGKTIQGTWRTVREDEKQAWEGGPAIWLLNARGGQDYQVRGDRQPGWTGWIDIGIGKGRQAVQYGQKR